MDERARERLASVTRYLEFERRSNFILTLPFPIPDNDLKALNGHPGITALLHHREAANGDDGGSAPGIDAEAAVWRLPECGARDIVFAGPWWLISRQMIDEARQRGIRCITHFSWGHWIRNSLEGLVALKIARRLVRFPLVELPDLAVKYSVQGTKYLGYLVIQSAKHAALLAKHLLYPVRVWARHVAQLAWVFRLRAALLRKAKHLILRHPRLKRALVRLLSLDVWHRIFQGTDTPAPRRLTAEDFEAVLRDARETDDYVERRVVLVCGSLQPGGAERQVVNTLLELKDRGLESVRLLCDRLVPGHPERYDHYLPVIDGTGIEVRSLMDAAPREGPDSGTLPRSLAEGTAFLPLAFHADVVRLYHEFRDIRPEVVHAWLDWSNTRAGLAAVLAGVPRIILSCRNINPSNFALYHPHMDPAYLALARFPGVTFVNNSHAGAADYARWLGLPESRFGVIYNGVSLEGRERSSPTETAARRARLGIPEGHRVVGSTFRFCAEKRPLLWVECAAAIAAQRPDTSFVIHGEGPMRREMMDKAHELGVADRLHLPGITDDMVGALSAMDALLLTSYGEGTPNVALEAQWLGIPVIATDAGGVRECIEEGMTGSVVPSTDARVLARRVLDYLNDPDLRARCERSGNAFIRERFGLARMIEETLAAYGYGTEGRSSGNETNSTA